MLKQYSCQNGKKKTTVRAEYLSLTAQVFLELCDLLFAHPCTEWQRLITAGKIIPIPTKYHNRKSSPTTWDIQLLAVKNSSRFAMLTYLYFLTLEKQNDFRQLALLCLFSGHQMQKSCTPARKGEKHALQNRKKYSKKWRKYRLEKHLTLVRQSLMLVRMKMRQIYTVESHLCFTKPYSPALQNRA